MRYTTSPLNNLRTARLGFTLIELLVVIAIIGLLASIVLASLNSARIKSRDTRRIADIKQIQVALEFFYDGIGNAQYPVSIPATCDPANPNGNFGLKVLATNGYIPAVPRDPLASGTTGCYPYATPASGVESTYHLGATMEINANNVGLNNDRDCNDQVAAPVPVCPTGTGAVGGFSGVDPMYDVVP